VVGEVKNPGVYPCWARMGLLDLISCSGRRYSNAGKAVTVTHRAILTILWSCKWMSKPGSTAAS